MIKNITWLTLGNITVKPLWFAFMTFVCWRILGGREYGVMVATMALAVVVVNLANFGTSEYSVREVARNRSDASTYFSNFFFLRVATTVVGLGVTIIIGVLLGYRGGDATALLFAGCYAMAQSLTTLCHAFYHAFESFKYEAVSVVADKVLTVGLGTLFLLAEPRASWVLAGLAIGMTLTMTGNIAWLSRRFARLHPRVLDRHFMRRALPQALPLGLAGIFVLLYHRTGSILVEAMEGELAAGQYGLAFRFVEALIFLPALVVTVFLPRLSQLFGDGNADQFRRLVVRGAALLGVSSVSAAIAVTLSAPWLISLVDTGAHAEPAILALQILVWSFPFSSIGYLLVTALTAIDDQIRLAFTLALAAAVNVALNLALIPIWSLYGACAATLITQGLLVVAMLSRYNSRRSILE